MPMISSVIITKVTFLSEPKRRETSKQKQFSCHAHSGKECWSNKTLILRDLEGKPLSARENPANFPLQSGMLIFNLIESFHLVGT